MSLRPATVLETVSEMVSAKGSDSELDGLLNPGSSQALVSLAAHGKRQTRQHREAFLTLREARILKEITQGASNKLVAQRLQISPSTVRTHMENIFRKLECSTRAAAAFKAATLGLIY